MSQVFVWISFPRVIFLCTFATLFCVCTDLRAWCAVKHLQEMYWDFSFHFEKSSWNSFTLRFIGAQPFILQSAVFRLTRRKTDTNATPVQTTVLRFMLLFFPYKYETVRAVHFARDELSICQVICKSLWKRERYPSHDCFLIWDCMAILD